MDRPFILRATLFVLVGVHFFDDTIVFRGEIDLHFTVVAVLVVIERGVLNRFRTATDVDVVIVLVGRRPRSGRGGHALGGAGRNLRVERRR